MKKIILCIFASYNLSCSAQIPRREFELIQILSDKNKFDNDKCLRIFNISDSILFQPSYHDDLINIIEGIPKKFGINNLDRTSHSTDYCLGAYDILTALNESRRFALLKPLDRAQRVVEFTIEKRNNDSWFSEVLASHAIRDLNFEDKVRLLDFCYSKYLDYSLVYFSYSYYTTKNVDEKKNILVYWLDKIRSGNTNLYIKTLKHFINSAVSEAIVSRDQILIDRLKIEKIGLPNFELSPMVKKELINELEALHLEE